MNGYMRVLRTNERLTLWENGHKIAPSTGRLTDGGVRECMEAPTCQGGRR